jgi:flagellar basal-body rod modification protein FlgD
MVSQVNSITTASKPNTQRIPKKNLDMQDFIQLFITQLRYQDPMNPIENNDMAIQLALFNQVDQLFKINKTLDTLVNMAKSLDLAYVSNLLGKKVKVEKNVGRVENGEFLGGEFNLDEPVNYLEL